MGISKMSEAVLYCDVTFNKRNADDSSSSLTETTYSEVNVSKMQQSVASQEGLSHRGSKVRSERVPVLVAGVLLIAAIIGLGVLSFYYLALKEDLRTLQQQNKALKNMTEELRPKCERCWELQGGKCYYFSFGGATWQQSRDECRRQGGELVKIDSREEQEFLESIVRKEMKDDEDKFWIGLTDLVVEGRWLWVDGSELNTSLTFWNRNEPDNWKGEDCVRMGVKAGADDLRSWFDRACHIEQRRICEKPAGTGL
ncbi:hypothetical protein Q5P01_018661 [Channa striata]|uniref:C-type lectin domain-containing protein n=1 Tax=Channa striata TaxID=64152 RepID=A0AA88M588_CHASR|nr:hypothetical protein Q5P01_018661 [Channa striata]